MRFEALGLTHEGRVRSQNQDSFATSPSLLLVADGMGGHKGGEVASTLVRDEVVKGFTGTLDSLYDAVHAAQDAVLSAAAAPELSGMGTTLVLAALTDMGLVVLWAGDSRLYLLPERSGRMYQVTEDDSYVASLVRSGSITLEEARHHPMKNVITRSLGQPSLEITTVRLDAEDSRLLLCSDGLTNELTDEQIRFLLAEGTPAEAAQALLDATLCTPARDNVTVVVADVHPED